MNTILVALFALVLGGLFLLWGYRILLVMLPIWGFFAGFWLGAQTTMLLFGDGFLATTTGWVVGFVAGPVFGRCHSCSIYLAWLWSPRRLGARMR